jgi:5'-deoxynucleotidase YfbR-like HD superfamily hydrolase
MYTSKTADALVDLARVALAFGKIDRTSVYHEDGSPESDSDHTVMLGWAACALAFAFCPDLNVGAVAQYALVHDAVEVYAGDTPTLRITSDGRAAKAEREDEAALRLCREFGGVLIWFPAMVIAYEAQFIREAKFVKAVDKIMPKLVHLLDGCRGLIEQGMKRAELVDFFTGQRKDIAQYAGEFTFFFELYTELANRLLAHPAVQDGTAGGLR